MPQYPRFLNICHSNHLMATTSANPRTALILVATSKQLSGVQVYTAQEAALFRKFLPYSFENGKHFDPSDRHALLDANQRMFNIVAKLDHTYASMLCRVGANVSDEFRGKAAPVAAAMETLSGYHLPESGKLGMYALKMGLLDSISATVRQLAPGIDYILRAPNFNTLPQSPYLRVLRRYSCMLNQHFQAGSSFFLYGSAAKGGAKPKDADFCAITPFLGIESYGLHMHYATRAKRITSGTLPLAFSIIPSSHFNPFALSDSDCKFALAGNVLSGKGVNVPLGDANWRASITITSVLQSALRLREALVNWAEVSRNPIALKARLSEPFYALSSLASIFGDPKHEIKVKKFSPGDVNKFEAVDCLIDSNLAMQEIIAQYAERMEKE